MGVGKLLPSENVFFLASGRAKFFIYSIDFFFDVGFPSVSSSGFI